MCKVTAHVVWGCEGHKLPRGLAALLRGERLKHAAARAHSRAVLHDALHIPGAVRAGLIAVGHVVEASDELARGCCVAALKVAAVTRGLGGRHAASAHLGALLQPFNL